MQFLLCAGNYSNHFCQLTYVVFTRTLEVGTFITPFTDERTAAQRG